MVIKEILLTNNKYNQLLLNIKETGQEYELTIDDIIFLHKVALDKFGGKDGIRDEGLLESISKNLYQSVFGRDLYPTIFDKSSKLLYDFADYQVFIDGNKRVGILSSIALLNTNGYELILTPIELYNLTMDIANKRITLEEVSKILKNASVKVHPTIISNNIKDEIRKEFIDEQER